MNVADMLSESCTKALHAELVDLSEKREQADQAIEAIHVLLGTRQQTPPKAGKKGRPPAPIVCSTPKSDALAERLQSRIDELESIFRQIEGTITVFIKTKKLFFSAPQTQAIFNDLLDKWREESRGGGGRRQGRPPTREAQSRLPTTAQYSNLNETSKTNGKNPAAVALGMLGGKKGGKARAENLSKERRSEIARDAANRRWERVRGSNAPASERVAEPLNVRA